MITELEINQEVKEGILILHLRGDITKASGESLLRFKPWDQGLEKGTIGVALDFAEVEYINSSGIAALIRLVRLLNAGQYPVGCYQLIFHYEKLFKMVSLTKYMTIYPSEWAALEGLSLKK